MIGIEAIEEVVQSLSTQPRPTVDLSEADPVCRLLSDEQLQELWLRNEAEIVFEEVLGDLLAPADLQELKRAMFERMYLRTFGIRERA